MSRNRKHQSLAARYAPAVKALALCLFVGGSGVGYVWQIDQLKRLWESYCRTESRYQRLRVQNDLLAKCLADLESVHEIEAGIRRNELGLVPAQPSQTVLLMEHAVVAESPANREERFFAEQRTPILPNRRAGWLP